MFSNATHGLGSVQRVRGSTRYQSWGPIGNLRQAVIDWFHEHPDEWVNLKDLIDMSKPEGWTEGRLGPLLRGLASEGILIKGKNPQGGPAAVWALNNEGDTQ